MFKIILISLFFLFFSSFFFGDEVLYFRQSLQESLHFKWKIFGFALKKNKNEINALCFYQHESIPNKNHGYALIVIFTVIFVLNCSKNVYLMLFIVVLVLYKKREKSSILLENFLWKSIIIYKQQKNIKYYSVIFYYYYNFFAYCVIEYHFKVYALKWTSCLVRKSVSDSIIFY